MTSKLPPIVSPASRARSMAAIISRSTVSVGAVERASAPMSRASSNVTASGSSSDTDPIAKTWLTIWVPTAARSWRASEPIATRAAVSRALARSRTLRMSSWPYFTTPARSAWPGRGRVTTGRSAPDAPAGWSCSTCIVRCQLSQSLFGITRAMGAPVVRPWRMPLITSARSDSMAIRRPRPYPPWRRRSSDVIASKSIANPAGMPSRIVTSALPCDSPAVRNLSIAASF